MREKLMLTLIKHVRKIITRFLIEEDKQPLPRAYVRVQRLLTRRWSGGSAFQLRHLKARYYRSSVFFRRSGPRQGIGGLAMLVRAMKYLYDEGDDPPPYYTEGSSEDLYLTVHIIIARLSDNPNTGRVKPCTLFEFPPS